MRDLLLVAGITVTAIAVGALLFFFGPSSLQSDMISSLNASQKVGTTTVPFTVLIKGPDAVSIMTQTNYRITSRTDLSALWTLIYGDKNVPALPQVDFAKNEVLGIFDGPHQAKGFDVALVGVQDGNGARLITIQHQARATSCATIPGMSSPFELILISKTTNTLQHTDTQATTSCTGNKQIP